jgi:hypothetical protein
MMDSKDCQAARAAGGAPNMFAATKLPCPLLARWQGPLVAADMALASGRRYWSGEARLLRGPFHRSLPMRCDAMAPSSGLAVSGDSDERVYTTAQYAAMCHRSGCTPVVVVLQFVRIV